VLGSDEDSAMDDDKILQIGSSFQTIDEVQHMIQKLKRVEEFMKKESNSPPDNNEKTGLDLTSGDTKQSSPVSNGLHPTCLDDIDLIDDSDMGDVENWWVTYS